MVKILRFEEMCSEISKMKFQRIYENLELKDRRNFRIIFDSLYLHHLSLNERYLIENELEIINEEILGLFKKKKKENEEEGEEKESLFSKLYDKAKRGALKISSAAEGILNTVVQKAKDLLDFGKKIAFIIGDYIKENLLSKIKSYALKEFPFAEVLVDFLDKEKQLKAKTLQTISFVKFLGVDFIPNLTNRLTSLFSKVLKTGTNEGFQYLENDFLLENNEDGDKKSFLQRLISKVMSYPPFTWINELGNIVEKGINFIAQKIIDFFSWLQGKDIKSEKGEVVLKKTAMDGKYEVTEYVKSISFLLQILKLYSLHKTKEFTKNLDQVKDKSDKITNLYKDGLEEIGAKKVLNVLTLSDLEPEKIMIAAKNASKYVPFVGPLIEILDILVKSVGLFLAIEPIMKKVGVNKSSIASLF
jgi:hypothetical protein